MWALDWSQGTGQDLSSVHGTPFLRFRCLSGSPSCLSPDPQTMVSCKKPDLYVYLSGEKDNIHEPHSFQVKPPSTSTHFSRFYSDGHSLSLVPSPSTGVVEGGRPRCTSDSPGVPSNPPVGGPPRPTAAGGHSRPCRWTR